MKTIPTRTTPTGQLPLRIILTRKVPTWKIPPSKKITSWKTLTRKIPTWMILAKNSKLCTRPLSIESGNSVPWNKSYCDILIYCEYRKQNLCMKKMFFFFRFLMYQILKFLQRVNSSSFCNSSWWFQLLCGLCWLIVVKVVLS